MSLVVIRPKLLMEFKSIYHQAALESIKINR